MMESMSEQTERAPSLRGKPAVIRFGRPASERNDRDDEGADDADDA